MLDYLTLAAPHSRTARFILENGKAYEIGPLTYAGPRDEPKSCFRNATMAALFDENLTYVEGLISMKGIPIDHAWLIDRDGNLIDPTLPDGEYIDGYFGVAFSTDYLRRATLKNKYYGLLGEYSRKTLPALFEGKVQFAPCN